MLDIPFREVLVSDFILVLLRKVLIELLKCLTEQSFPWRNLLGPILWGVMDYNHIAYFGVALEHAENVSVSRVMVDHIDLVI
jgi:hypothetical protein